MKKIAKMLPEVSTLQNELMPFQRYSNGMEDDDKNLKYYEDEIPEYGSTTVQPPASPYQEKELNDIYEEIGLGPVQLNYICDIILF